MSTDLGSLDMAHDLRPIEISDTDSGSPAFREGDRLLSIPVVTTLRAWISTGTRNFTCITCFLSFDVPKESSGLEKERRP